MGEGAGDGGQSFSVFLHCIELTSVRAARRVNGACGFCFNCSLIASCYLFVYKFMIQTTAGIGRFIVHFTRGPSFPRLQAPLVCVCVCVSPANSPSHTSCSDTRFWPGCLSDWVPPPGPCGLGRWDISGARNCAQAGWADGPKKPSSLSEVSSPALGDCPGCWIFHGRLPLLCLTRHRNRNVWI